jgi:hypothetical protein
MLGATGFLQGEISIHAQHACGSHVTAIRPGPKNEFTGYFRSRRPRSLTQTSCIGGGRHLSDRGHPISPAAATKSLNVRTGYGTLYR